MLVIKDAPFSPWTMARSERLRGFVAQVASLVEGQENRVKRRRPKDQDTFLRCVEAVICDLIRHYLSKNEDGLYIPRGNDVLCGKSRYKPQIYGKTFLTVVDGLEAVGMLIQKVSKPGTYGTRERSTITPAPLLIDHINALGLTMADLGSCKDATVEPIALKRPKKADDWWDTAELIEYDDTPETKLLRTQMEEINGWLAAANLECTDPTVITDQRHLSRVFTKGRFDRGGRMFGGFWDGMSKAKRFDTILIDDEHVAELDFSSMGPRQLYGWTGIQPPDHDLYALEGYEQNREGIKKLFASMVFRSERPETLKFPRGSAVLFDKSHRCEDVVKAIETTHSAIADMFFIGKGHRIQFDESSIMVQILLTLKAEGITALPIHDALLVARSKVEAARLVMLETFKHYTGADALVEVSMG